MLHPDDHHYLLAPTDLERHVPESHQVEAADAAALFDITEAFDYLALYGIDPTDMTEREIILEVWHTLVHDADEDQTHEADRPLLERIRSAGQLSRGGR